MAQTRHIVATPQPNQLRIIEVAKRIKRKRKIRDEFKLLGRNGVALYPWRSTSNKLHALVAEVLLQRTTAKAALNVYNIFVVRFPALDELANATESEVLEVISPLGIYSRAKLLIQLARKIQAEFGGNVPSDYGALRTLPGVGDYIASAFLSIHCNQRLPISDSNVQRVANRLVGAKISAPLALEFYNEILPQNGYKEFTLGFLDLAMKVCRPNPWKPMCHECILKDQCEAGLKIRNGVPPSFL